MKDQWINIITFIGTIDVVVIPIYFAINGNWLFPRPGLYFIELWLVGLLAAYSIFSRRWLLAPWLASGVLAAHVIVGAMTIGFFLIPAMLAYAVAAALWMGPSTARLLRYAGFAVLVMLVQVRIMLLIRYL